MHTPAIATDRLGSGWMVISAALFALTSAFAKAAGSRFGFGFNELVFWRMLFGLLAIGLPAWWRGHAFRTPYLVSHLNRSITGSVALLLSFHAIVHLPLATAVTLNYTSSLFLALLSFLFLKEQITPRMWAALLMGFGGIVLLLRPTIAADQQLAGLIGLASGLGAGWAYLQVRELSLLGEPSWRVVFYFCCVATAMSGVLASIQGWHRLAAESLPYLFGLGVCGTLAQLAMTRAYQVGHKLTVASLSYLTVVFSTLLGIFWLGDSTSWHEIAGMLVIVGAGVLGSFAKGR
ncbi:DMT family transporter [Eikenella sp. S3360]|uniref:DMT family transporter n=1 Tax=Eikenella glucosivorans TaxID=2766967 RepID=A0ABS0NCL4_9NEIS|nr:DMT family transporter [Eikenella glucosivorans]MBH5329994.1 DMT family transporter [Eikenella glucosivorans]